MHTALISQEAISTQEYIIIQQLDKDGNKRLPKKLRPRVHRDLRSNNGVESGTLVLPPGSTKFSEIAVGCEVCMYVCVCLRVCV